MALVLLDRAKETTIVLGTTASTILLGAVTGYQSFAGVGNANTTYYCIAEQAGTNWEVGLGTYTLVGTTITRAATPLSSSNAGASVSFPAGTKDVFIVYPSSKGVWLDGSGNAIGLGTPAAFVATNVTGLPLTTGITGTLPVANGGTGVTTSTGTGAVVLNTSPTLVTPALGTPSALVGTNITGTATAFTASNVTINANLTGAVTSVGNASSLGSFTSAQLATALTDESGTGANVFATSPTLVTPILGTPTSGTLTTCTGLPLTTGVTGTLPIANGGTNSTATPTAGGVVYGTGAAHAITVAGTSGQVLTSAAVGSPTWTTPTTGTVTSVATSGNVSGITLTGGTITGSGTITLGGAIGTLNQNTTGSSGSCTGNAATATALSTASGSAPSYSARAWVNFNGTGTVAIRASGNVTSITDNGVGDYTVNFTTAMPDANYSIGISGYQNTAGSICVGFAHGGTYTASAVRVVTYNSAFAITDMQNVSVSIFR